MGLVQVIIDDSTNKIITGTYTFDRVNGGTLEVPHGTSFPSTPQAHELFWRDDESKLYKRNAANTAWEVVIAIPAAHADSHEQGGSDEISHQELSGAGFYSHNEIDAHVDNRQNPHEVTKQQIGLGNVTNDAQLKRAGGDFVTFPSKFSVAHNDALLIEDSGASYEKKKINVIQLLGAVENGHAALRQLIHFIDEGPAEELVGEDGALKEVVWSGAFPTKITWWDSPERENKILEVTYTWNGPVVVSIQWKIFDKSGNVLRSLKDDISYSGVFEISRTRTVLT